MPGPNCILLVIDCASEHGPRATPAITHVQALAKKTKQTLVGSLSPATSNHNNDE